jgi:hypothetical protein
MATQQLRMLTLVRSTFAAVLALTLTLGARPLCAQPSTGTVAGSVTASTGTGLAGATVTAVDSTSGVERAVVTDDDGEYAIVGLPPGSYELRAALDGFAPVTRGRFTVTAGGRAEVGFLLVPIAAESLSVTGPAIVLDQQRSTLQQTIPDRLAHSVPLIGRDFIALAMLTPGFTGNPVAPSPNGQIYWSNNVVVDGASHFSKWRAAARTFYSGYPLEAIQEVQVLNSQFAAEHGEALASVTSAVTRSGTNERHGSVLFFGQAGVLNDQPVFSARKPPASSARFGVTLGGPMSADRTFYFGSYEGRRSRSNNFVVSPAAPGVAVPDNEDEHLGFLKVDHRRSSNDLMSFRYNGQRLAWRNETGGLTLPGSGTQYRTDVHTVLGSLSQLISVHSLNQVRFQFARYADRRTDLKPSVYVSRAGYSTEGGTLGPLGFGVSPEDTYEASDTVSHVVAGHAVKIGGGIRYVRAHSESLPFGHGGYYFDGPPELYPQPSIFVQGFATVPGSTVVDSRSLASYAFVQDEWRANARFTSNVGVRYDVEQITGVTGYDASTDTNNVQPRASATWTPFGGRFAVRGGAGIYNQQHLLYYVNRAQLEGASGSGLITLTPASALMPVFPAVVSASILNAVPRDVYTVEPTFRNPYSVQAALGVQYVVTGATVSADYVYLSGHDLMSIVDANAPASASQLNPRSVAQADATRPVVPVGGGFRKLITLGNEGRSWYRALQVRVERSLSSYQLLSAYTLARARDMANYELPQDSRNIRAEEAPADNDIRHNVSMGITWRLPFTAAALRDWTLSALGQFRSHRPYTIWYGYDRNGTTQVDARPGGRNTGKGDGYQNIDLALARRVMFGARALELRAEAFNVLSTVNDDQYMGALSSPLFGQPISAFPKRRLQFAAILRF